MQACNLKPLPKSDYLPEGKNSSAKNTGISIQNFSFALLTTMHCKNICLADFSDVK